MKPLDQEVSSQNNASFSNVSSDMQILLLSIGALLLLCPGIYGEEKPEFEITPGMKLEQKMVAEWLKVRSGKVVRSLQRHSIFTPDRDEQGNPINEDFVIESDGVNVRSEDPYQERNGCVYKEINIRTPKELIQIISDRKTIFIKRTPRIVEPSEHFSWLPVSFGDSLSSRIILGIVSNEELLLSKENFAHLDRFNEIITDETMNGIPVKHISYDLPKEKHIDYWLAPQRNYLPLKVVYKSMIETTIGVIDDIESRTVEELTTYEYEWKQYPPGVWFPSKWTYVNKRDNIITSDNELITQEADFETPIPPERFTIQSVTETKKKIVYYEDSLRYTSEGIIPGQEHVVRLDKLRRKMRAEEAEKQNTVNMWGKIVGVVAILFLVVLVFKQIFSKTGRQ